MRKIEKLKEENNLFDRVLWWNYELWYKKEGWSKEKLKVYMQQSLNEHRLPITLIATEDEKVIGTCQLAMNDLDVRPQYYPWLINLSVDEAQRGKGIGQSLVKEAITQAKKLAFHELYLYTEHEGYFEKIGFELVEIVEIEPGSQQFVRVYKRVL